MGIFIKIVQLLFSLSILVVIHEFGHFAFAKLFKTRVEKFYLFFNPWFSLFKVKKGETEYGIGWLPLGGYVKISGMIDESMDREQMKKPPQPWEFRSKRAWQRLLIMLGGVIANFILAGIIYIAILFTWGEDYLPNKNVEYGIMTDSTSYELGFRNGDKVISVNGKEPTKFKQIVPEILLNTPAKVEIERNNEKLKISINEKDIAKLTKAQGRFISPRFLFVADSVLPGSNAEKAGVKNKDRFIALNGEEKLFFDQYSKFFKNNKGVNVQITALRNEDTVAFTIASDTLGNIGVITNYPNQFEFSHQNYDLSKSIPAGLSKGVEQTQNYLKQLKLIFNPETEAYKSLGSFITIGNLFPGQWHWESFWELTAFISIILGIMNLLPIPALDGGHVVFLLFEMITGKKPSEKVLEYAQLAGFVILILLMVFAIRNDFLRFVF